ncbi:MAG: tetratricopeptide repeat protein [Candidatus Eremiobacteraeota bacterium]|nr:tetratricopeptide repeat protein [Candidatus Eremiobacteraeota bacterium]
MDWEARLAQLWAAIDDYEPVEFLEEMRALTSERPPGDAVALFELAGAHDSTGHEDEAAVLYRSALDAGLSGLRRRRAIIQMASTLRNLGKPEESLALLTAERDAGSDELDDAVVAFTALALADLGREKEAIAMTVLALSRHLNRYNRSLKSYSEDLSLS